MNSFYSRVNRAIANDIVGIYRTIIFHSNEFYLALQWIKAFYECLKLIFPQLPNIPDLP